MKRGLLFCLFYCQNMAAASDFSRYQVPCPTDPTLYGYTSIDSLNLEMKHHASLVSAPLSLPLRERYVYTLCPNLVYEGSQQLTLLLPRTLVICGREGTSMDQCVIQGGSTQVLLIDTAITSTTSRRIFVLQGLTFTASQDMSIAALASNATRAEFIDCHWKQSSGSAAIFMALGHAVSVPFHTPEITFRFDHNIFAQNIRRDLQSSASPAREVLSWNPYRRHLGSSSYPMSVSLVDCTIEDSGHDDSHFQAISNHGGSLELTRTTFSNNQGLFVVSVVHGGWVQIYDSTFSDNNVTGAILRGMEESTVEVAHSQFLGNVHSLATIATLETSDVAIESTYFDSNQPVFGQVVILANSWAHLEESCWRKSSTGIVVDKSSQLDTNHDNYIESSNVDAHCPSSGHVFVLESDCWSDGLECTGSCVPIMEARQCPLDSNPIEASSAASLTVANMALLFLVSILHAFL